MGKIARERGRERERVGHERWSTGPRGGCSQTMLFFDVLNIVTSARQPGPHYTTRARIVLSRGVSEVYGVARGFQAKFGNDIRDAGEFHRLFPQQD